MGHGAKSPLFQKDPARGLTLSHPCWGEASTQPQCGVLAKPSLHVAELDQVPLLPLLEYSIQTKHGGERAITSALLGVATRHELPRVGLQTSCSVWSGE